MEKKLQLVEETSRSIIERGVKHAPVLLVGRNDELLPVMLSDFDEVKGEFPCWAPALLEKLEADWYLMIFEAWVTTDPSEERARKLQAGELHVSDLPLDDRFEVLTLVGGNRAGTEKVHAWAKIHDTPSGRKMDPLKRFKGNWQSRFYIESW